jgi:hypothetical protein
MLVIPRHRSSNSSVIAVVDGLPRFSRHIRLHPELIEKDVEALVFILGQADKSVVERKRSILHFFENGLKNNNILEGGFHLKEVYTGEKGICIWDDIVPSWKRFCADWSICQDKWLCWMVLVVVLVTTVF